MTAIRCRFAIGSRRPNSEFAMRDLASSQEGNHPQFKFAQSCGRPVALEDLKNVRQQQLASESCSCIQHVMDMDVLVFSHLRWDFVYQRPQHLLSRFAKHRRVFFWEEPIHREVQEPFLARTSREGMLEVIVP